MRKWLIILATIALVVALHPVVSAQIARFRPSPYIYRVQAGSCKQEPKTRIQTGFRVRNQVGIITALHGVVGCKSITASSEADGATFRDLIIGSVDTQRDAALLWSKALQSAGRAGFDSVTSENEAESNNLTVIGYPLGVFVQRPLVDVEIVDVKQLIDLLPPEAVTYMKLRDSPSLVTESLSIQAHLLPGHSGAPVLTKDQAVVGIGNGGLRSGSVEWAWAMPVYDIKWQPVATEVSTRVSAAELDRLREIEKIDLAIDLAFAFSLAEPPREEPTELTLLPAKSWVDRKLKATFSQIPAGYFQYGSTFAEANKALDVCYEYSGKLCGWEAFQDEIVLPLERGKKYLPDYWIMQTEVTNAQYEDCIRSGGCNRPSKRVYPPGRSDHPVRLSEVKYALEYANWACARLPTELEWEKAARGPDAFFYPWGNDWEAGRANFCGDECTKQPQTAIERPDDGYPETAPVTTFADGRSPYGLYHMAGNVREWVSRDPERLGISHDYMMKGGSFYDFPDVLRTADRLRSPIDSDGTVTAGFRVVRDRVGDACR